MTNGQEEKSKWRLDRAVGLPSLFLVLVQTLTFAWYGGQLTKTVELQGNRQLETENKVNALIQNQSRIPELVIRLQVVEQEIATLRLKAENMALQQERNNIDRDRRTR